MEIIAVLASIFLAQTSARFVVDAQRYSDDRLTSPEAAIFTEIAYREKRGNKAEPTCEELRAMWIYSKRQSRAAETTNDLPMYRDPFSYNIWDTYPVRSPNSLGYRETVDIGYWARNINGGRQTERPTKGEPPIYRHDKNNGGQARSRGAGGAIIYGKVVHKAPAGSRLRNGMPNRMKNFEEMTRLYGTVNRQMPDPRRRQTSFRVGGGPSSPSMSQVPQAGSFQHLKELIRTERARELQEQRDAEEMAARAAVLKEIVNGERREAQESPRQFLNSVQPYQEAKSVNYGYGQSQYVPSIANFGGGGGLLTGEKYDRDSMLHK